MAVSSIYGNPNSNAGIWTTEDDYYAKLGKKKPVTAGTSDTELGMGDFMKLLAAQMSNQDMMNPVSDTDFIAQMAQFSALSAMQTLTEYSLSSYAVSYVGKHVIITSYDDLTNDTTTVYGEVERVTFMNGDPKVVVDGKEYDLHTVMEIANAEIRPANDVVKEAVGMYAAVDAGTDANGYTQIIFGLVSKATYRDGKNQVLVNGTYYDYSKVLKLSDKALGDANWQTEGWFPKADPDAEGATVEI